MPSCIALFSGGLDSMLALRLMTSQGVDTVAFYARNCFHGADDPEAKEERLRQRALALGAREFVVRDLTDALVGLVKNPRYGRGKNMNPCLDCRIRTLAEAARLRDELGADFVVTGEVVGQRPMSQRRDAMRTVDRHAREMGLEGRLLRPLSAKLLDATLPETEGRVDREKLGDFSGRGRNPQLRLAAELGINDFPSPAGGCLLTDPGYSLRLRDLDRVNPDWTADDAELLKIGRHFRLAPELRIVASRRADENEKMKTRLPRGSTVFVTDERPGAMVALVRHAAGGVPSNASGDSDACGAAPASAAASEKNAAPNAPEPITSVEEAESLAAGLAVYYSKYRAAPDAAVARWDHGVPDSRRVVAGVAPLDPERLKARYIGIWQGGGKPTGGE